MRVCMFTTSLKKLACHYVCHAFRSGTNEGHQIVYTVVGTFSVSCSLYECRAFTFWCGGRETGTVVGASSFPTWKNVPLAKLLQEKTGRPVRG